MEVIPQDKPKFGEKSPKTETTSTATSTVVVATPESGDETIRKIAKSEVEVPNDLQIKQTDLDEIKDPVARQKLEAKFKDWERGFYKKYQELAEERKRVQEQVNQPWTPQRLQQEIQRQDFIDSAKIVQSQIAPPTFEGTQTDWDGLSDQKRQEFANLQMQVRNQQTQLSNMASAQEDEHLKTKYPNYDPTSVNQAIQDMLQGRRIATREDIHKVINYERDIKRAYQLAIQDKAANVQEKFNGSTNLGLSTQTHQKPPDIKPGERGGFAKIARFNYEKGKS